MDEMDSSDVHWKWTLNNSIESSFLFLFKIKIHNECTISHVLGKEDEYIDYFAERLEQWFIWIQTFLAHQICTSWFTHNGFKKTCDGHSIKNW